MGDCPDVVSQRLPRDFNWVVHCRGDLWDLLGDHPGAAGIVFDGYFSNGSNQGRLEYLFI